MSNCTELYTAVKATRGVHIIAVFCGGLIALINVVRFIIHGRDCLRETDEEILDEKEEEYSTRRRSRISLYIA